MLGETFQIQHIVVPEDERLDEQVGSKTKFWFATDDARPNQLWKRARACTYEDVSEKLAAELGRLLGIALATVELAECDDQRGTASTSFLVAGDRLIHGNEALVLLDRSYPGGVMYGAAQHTVRAAIAALDRLAVAPWPDWGTAETCAFRGADLFAGYLLFDAWIGNTDRHHENWAIVQRGSGRFLAPSYDHASSLGRTESADKIARRLRGNDHRNTVENYAARARSAFYAADSIKTVHPVDAFVHAEHLCPNAASYWRNRLDGIRTTDVESLVHKIPATLWSPIQREFVKKLLEVNRNLIRATHG